MNLENLAYKIIISKNLISHNKVMIIMIFSNKLINLKNSNMMIIKDIMMIYMKCHKIMMNI